jgi:hypothetical protein
VSDPSPSQTATQNHPSNEKRPSNVINPPQTARQGNSILVLTNWLSNATLNPAKSSSQGAMLAPNIKIAIQSQTPGPIPQRPNPSPTHKKGEQKANREWILLETPVTPSKQTTAIDSNREENAVFKPRKTPLFEGIGEETAKKLRGIQVV